jgi:murein L,D-transpeptidase YcbB/YkuD
MSSVNWTKYTAKNFPFILRQRDGDENTLGILKFIFPNNNRIYLHDTNSKGMFNNDDRNLSHGCIRLEKALELAEEISKCCALNFNSDTISKYVNFKTRKLFTLYKPLPILIRYYTIKADSSRISIYPDVYSIDKKIIQSLADRSRPDQHHPVN